MATSPAVNNNSAAEKGKLLLDQYRSLSPGQSGKKRGSLVPRVATLAKPKTPQQPKTPPSSAGKMKSTPLPRVATLGPSGRASKSPQPVKFPGLTEHELAGSSPSAAGGKRGQAPPRRASLVPRVALLAPKSPSTDSAAGSSKSSSPSKPVRKPSSSPLPRVALLAAKKKTTPASPPQATASPLKTKASPLPRVALLAEQRRSKTKTGDQDKAPAAEVAAHRPARPVGSGSPSVFDRLSAPSSASKTSSPGVATSNSSAGVRPGSAAAASAKPKRTSKSQANSPSVFDRLASQQTSSSSTSSKNATGTLSTSSTASGGKKPPKRAQSSGAIFDKLTNPKLFTGSHKHRFDEDTGKGRGIQGRRSPQEKPFEETFRPQLQKAAAAGSPTKTAGDKKPKVAKYEPSPIFEKLLDPKQFTGSHKHRFDAKTGQGRGLAGRDRPEDFEGSFRHQLHHPSSPALGDRKSSKAKSDAATAAAAAAAAAASPTEYKPAPIFDKLLDPKLFTGSHKNRFDPDGKGRGLDGRDRPLDFEGSFRRELHHPSSPGLAKRKQSSSSAHPSPNEKGLYESKYEPSPVFDRLLNVDKFTGVYRERFDEKGHGKGLLHQATFEESLRAAPGSPKLVGAMKASPTANSMSPPKTSTPTIKSTTPKSTTPKSTTSPKTATSTTSKSSQSTQTNSAN